MVVFKFPEDPTRDFIKRVIGLPGETVEIRDKPVFVDGKPLDEPYVHFLEPPLRPDDPEYGLRGESIRDNWGPQVVPAGQLLVLGDNRDNSRDSRFWGFLPRRPGQGPGAARLLVVRGVAARSTAASGCVEWLKDTLSAFGRTRWKRFFHVIR